MSATQASCFKIREESKPRICGKNKALINLNCVGFIMIPAYFPQGELCLN